MQRLIRPPIVLDGDFNSQVAICTGKSFADDLPSILRTIGDYNATFNTHMEFLRAGANMIRTNTYRASIYNLNHFLGVDLKDSASVITRTAKMAQTAVQAYKHEMSRNPNSRAICPCVVGSCGPYGASLGNNMEYTGFYGKELSEDELMEWHEPRVRALLDAGVDILALGSVPCAKEAVAFAQLLRNFPSIPVWISFYCYNQHILADGTDFKTIVQYCHRTLGGQLLAIGVSCVESSLVSPLFRAIHRVTFPDNVGLVACPDKTSYRTKEDGVVEMASEKVFLDLPIAEWLNMGANIIGGCCGTVADDIRYIASEVQKYRNCAKPRSCSLADFDSSSVVRAKL